MLAQIQEICSRAGISQIGVCPWERALPLLEVRSQQRLPQNPKSILFCLFPYYIGEYPERNLSRYAIPDDYHQVGRELLQTVSRQLSDLFPRFQFVPFLDSSPLREREGAYWAGLGYRGKNGMLIHPQFGSYVFIGEIVTDLEIFWETVPLGDCIGCGACWKSCPGGALTPNGLEKSRCLSYITQKKGELTLEERQLLQKGGMVWGCDVCNDVCPMNREKKLSDIGPFYQNPQPHITLENYEELLKTKAFGYRGKQVIKRNLELLQGEEER